MGDDTTAADVPGDRDHDVDLAGDFGLVWEALDALPRSSAGVDMAATTVTLAAVTADRRREAGSPGTHAAPPASARGWLRPAVAAVGSLLVGIVLGRSTAPDPDRGVLESLPVVRHLGLLREAGSIAFLESLAVRRPQAPPRQPPAPLQDDAAEFDAAIADLERDHALGAAARTRLAERRASLAGLPADELEAVARSAAVVQDLSPTKRDELAALAAALADPARKDLRSAARLWHLIIAASDPADRRNIVDLDAAERIEWLERRPRWREQVGERRGPPPGVEGGPLPRGPAAGLPGPPGEGRPRWQWPRGEGGGPQGPRFEGRPRGEFGPRDGGGPRPETRAPPPRRDVDRREPPPRRDDQPAQAPASGRD